MTQNPSHPQIITAAPAHAMVLGELHARAFIYGDAAHRGITTQGNESWNAASIVATLSQPGVSGLIATTAEPGTDPLPVGFVLARTAADESEILTLAVDPAAQRQGWGRRLMDASFAHARTEGAEKMFLEVAADNEAAIALYQSLGFEEVATRKDYYRRKSTLMDALVMALSI